MISPTAVGASVHPHANRVPWVALPTPTVRTGPFVRDAPPVLHRPISAFFQVARAIRVAWAAAMREHRAARTARSTQSAQATRTAQVVTCAARGMAIATESLASTCASALRATQIQSPPAAGSSPQNVVSARARRIVRTSTAATLFRTTTAVGAAPAPVPITTRLVASSTRTVNPGRSARAGRAIESGYPRVVTSVCRLDVSRLALRRATAAPRAHPAASARLVAAPLALTESAAWIQSQELSVAPPAARASSVTTPGTVPQCCPPIHSLCQRLTGAYVPFLHSQG
jgi:hypothetical protein